MLCTVPASDLVQNVVCHWAFRLILEKLQQKELGFYLRPSTRNTAELENIQSKCSIFLVLFPQKIH